MKVLITSGNTATMIDKVRKISNIFGGRTGFDIANHFVSSGDDVTLLTSSSEYGLNFTAMGRSRCHYDAYKTYDELYNRMKEECASGDYDVIIHSAAVSDYKPVGTFDSNLIEVDSRSKISSSHKELFLKLVPTEKIVDNLGLWGFKGTLVKFKLQVDITDKELIEIAHRSRKQSNADFIVANCLEWARERAYICGEDTCESVKRNFLPNNLREAIVSKMELS
jgi:phosphopantothenate---cysteine ligase (CTP)